MDFFQQLQCPVRKLPCQLLQTQDTKVSASVAKDRSWFSDYRPIKSQLGDIYRIGAQGEGQSVIGIGTVHLPVKKSPTATGKDAHGILTLRNVLHVPSNVCNILGSPDDAEFLQLPFTLGPGYSILRDARGKEVCYLENISRFFHLKLSDPPIGPRVGPSPFDPSTHYFLSVHWDGKFEEVPTSPTPAAGNSTEDPRGPPLTSEERQWLKANYGNEFKFLQAYGLNIHKDDDVEEGRRIMRAMMQHDDED